MGATVISENDFKYGTSVEAQSLRARFGANGYKKYTAYINSIMTNPLKESHEQYTEAKKEQYKLALLNAKKSEAIWNQFKNNYNNNLAAMRRNNNGFSLSSTQRQQALQSSGSGAVDAMRNFQEAQSEVDYALSLYNDATHAGINFMG